MPVQLKLLPLSSINGDPMNPKDHDLGAIRMSINRFGFVAPMVHDGRTDRLLAGHGRLAVLLQMKAEGVSPPENVEAKGDEWFVPVMMGVRSRSDAEARAYEIADNRTTILGGWDDNRLLALLQGIRQEDESLLLTTGYDQDDVDDLLHMLQPPDLDALTRQYPEVDHSAFWPVIRLQVPPETFHRYNALLQTLPGETPAEQFAALLDFAPLEEEG